ncbi:MAG: transposase [Candidatus Sulfotelmatobacter sp.]
MSGPESIPSAVDKILENLDWANISDERTRQCIRLLLNLVETLNAELQKARAENQCLREQGQGRKGGGGPGSGDASGAAGRSSEKERRERSEAGERSPRRKRSKLDRIPIGREEVLKVDRATLPPDAEFKGYEDVVVQELRIATDNVKFRKEKYYSASTGKTYLAPLPVGYDGEYGPTLKSLCLLFSHLGNMTEPKIADVLANTGIIISAGQISRILRQAQERLQAEKEAIVEAGLSSSPWQHIDDTGTRVNGQNQHCHVLCNPLYTAYSTTARKDRMSVIDVLRNQRERVFRLNDEAYQLLRQFGVSQAVKAAVQQLPANQDWTEAELNRRLAEQMPNLGAVAREQVGEAAAIAAYHAETEHPVVRLLVCDDAKQFKLVTEELALCWVHDGRHYQSLEPCIGQHRAGLEVFREKYWEYYRALRAYQRAPVPERALELGRQFDLLFSTITGYAALDERIAKTKAKKESLLKVLEHPEIPLHNNPAELGARLRVRKRVVSYGPRSPAGVKAWDTMETLLGTAKKLGVNFFQYIRDRVSGAKQMSSLAVRIEEKARSLDLGSFVQFRGAPGLADRIPVQG